MPPTTWVSGKRVYIGTGDPYAERHSMVWGVDKPTTSNTGVVPGVSRTTVSGDQTLSSSSVETFTNVDFTGRVMVTGTGAKNFKNCWFHGNGSLNSGYGALHVTGGGHGLVTVEDCTFDIDDPDAYVNGILGHDFVARRCYFKSSVDHIGVHNTSAPSTNGNVVIEMCYMDTHYWTASDPNQVDGSHTDGIQLQGCNGTIIRGNYIRAYHDKSLISGPPYTRNGHFNGQPSDDTLARATSCVMITPNSGTVLNTTITKNWFAGGEIQVNAANGDNAGQNIGTFTDNRFERNSFYVGHTIDRNATSTGTFTGNVYDDDDTPITVRSV